MRLLLTVILAATLASCAPHEVDDYTGDYNLSVMSFNIRFDTEEDGDNQWDNRKEACIKMLKEEEPTIFGVQEALHNQVNYFKENLPNYDYVGVGRDDGHSSGEYAAIFYEIDKFEAVEVGNFWLSETPEYPSLGWDANNIRIVSWVKLLDKTSLKDIFVFNTHFDHLGKTAQLESSKLLVNKISEITKGANVPIFVCGDFNMLIGNSRMKPIIENLYCARRFAAKTDNYESYNAWGLGILSRNIDFIFYDNAYPQSFKTISKDYGVPYISDHYPIISHFNY